MDDVAIVGGGIVGLATAYQLLQRFPQYQVTLVEKEKHLAEHQTGHNSGVLHSGIYYQPGSMKATNCRAGKKRMEAFCENEGIPYEICGKVIVALDESELPTLERIFQRGQANGVQCTLVDRERLHELEPHAAGIRAIHVPEAGIVNYRKVCERLGERIQQAGGTIRLQAKVTQIRHFADHVVLGTTQGDVAARYVINCSGLYCDQLTRLSGQDPESKIVPFRGEYFEVAPEAHHLCRNLIYPVPNPSFPFLGVHFTRMIDGSVECGPNAVLAFAREGYNKWTINPAELWESITYRGFLKLAWKYWPVGVGEMWRSVSKGAFVRALQRLVPEIRREHLVPAPAGVRAQAITPQGDMVDDFAIRYAERVVNVCNAPSPAATSSLNIGVTIVDQLTSHSNL